MGLRASRELARDIKFDFLRFKSSFPGTMLAWSDMVARTSWRLARSMEGINKARIKVNKAVARFFVRNRGLTVRRLELEQGIGLYLRADGVHLNTVGIDL